MRFDLKERALSLTAQAFGCAPASVAVAEQVVSGESPTKVYEPLQSSWQPGKGSAAPGLGNARGGQS